MNDVSNAPAIGTALDMFNTAFKLRSALDIAAKRWLRSEKVVYEQEFRYPRMTKRESWFWNFYCAGVGFLLVLLTSLFPLILIIITISDVGVGEFLFLFVILILGPIVALMMLITSFFSTRQTMAWEREWMKVILTENFLVLVMTNMSGLQLHELYETAKEPRRFVSTIRIEKIVSLLPHITNWVIRRYRNRPEIVRIKLVRWGEIFDTKLGDSFYFPIPALDSFLAILRRLGPHIKIDSRLGVT